MVVGAGYVGLVAATCLSKSGHNVLCIEKDKNKVKQLKMGVPTIYEEGIKKILTECLANGNLRFSSDFVIEKDTEIMIIAVGTPSLPDGRVDLSYVEDVFRKIVVEIEHPLVVVMKSTVPPGIGEKLKQHYLNKAKAPISYVSNPEFLREGQAIWDWYNPDRIVIGGDSAESIDKVLELYSDIEAPKFIMNVTSAEMVKYASNAFLATKISFINEIANLCDLVGADITSVTQAMGKDQRIGTQFLKAGLGYGGSCFPKDTRALEYVSTLNGHKFNLLKAVIEVNQGQRILAVRKLKKALGELNGQRVGVLGIAFKPNTDDVREAPSLSIISLLLDEGAEVIAYDPIVKGINLKSGLFNVKITNDLLQAVKDCNALVICTEWREIINADWDKVFEKMTEPKVILDGRNCLPKRQIVELGFKYIGMGVQ